MAAAESYPEELKYHPEHDWGAHHGRRGDARHHVVRRRTHWASLVHYEPPDVGAPMIAKDASYGEAESVKAVSDLISPLSGEVSEVNSKVVDEPETVNEDPYGEGWLIRIGRRIPAEVDSLLDVDGVPQAAREPVTHPHLALTDADRERMLATIGVSSVDELFRDIPRGVRFSGSSTSSRRSPSRSSSPISSELAARNVDTRGSCRSSAPASTTTTYPRSSTPSSSAASSSPRTRRTSPS